MPKNRHLKSLLEPDEDDAIVNVKNLKCLKMYEKLYRYWLFSMFNNEMRNKVYPLHYILS